MRVLTYIVLLFIPMSIFSQTGSRTASLSLPSVALLDVEPSGSIVMNFTSPLNAGGTLISPLPNTSKWINYTSAISTTGLSRSITASINQNLPGIDIKLQATSASGIGQGSRGSSTGQQILSSTPKIIISGIGRSFTGSGTNNGHQLIFNLSIGNYEDLAVLNSNVIVVQFTILE